VNSDFASLLRREVAGFLTLRDSQVQALEAHWSLLSRWNRKLNLTAVRNPVEAIRKHYAESLFLATCVAGVPHNVIVDIGSGPGFPGFPLSVAFPDSSVVLIESHMRKAVFLREATRDAANVRVLGERAENVTGHFDLAIGRAVAWEELRPVMLRLAGWVGLLVSETDAGGIGSDASFHWLPARPLPWKGAGAVLVGQCFT
jgi:16S rRNA (guanine(527)-N(7))-methyltransferase RsmG